MLLHKMMHKLLSFVFMICCLQLSQCQNTFEGHIIKARKIMEHIPVLNELNGNLAKLVQSSDTLEMLLEMERFWKDASKHSSKECIAALKFAESNFNNFTINMVDATGKPQAAIRNGALHWVGGFDMCMSNPPPKNYKGPGTPLRSHYCRVTFAESSSTTLLDLKPKLYIGVCIPETCSSDDINGLIRYLIAEVKEQLPNVTLPSILDNDAVSCLKRTNELPFSGGAIVMIVLSCLFGVVIIIGTIYDILVFQLGKNFFASKETDAQRSIQSEPTAPEEMGNHNNYGQLEEETDEPKIEVKVVNPSSDLRGWQKMLLAFSAYSNSKKIIDAKQQSGRLNCLDGVRFLSMSWVILGHTYFFVVGYVNNLGSFYPMLFKRWTYEAIVNATFSVDSFFLLSGLLTSYMFLKEANRMTTIKSVKLWVLYFFHRYWRLTPPYMLFLGFYTALYKYMSNGPFYSQATGIDEPHCTSNWWTNLLYINNIVNSKQMCMGWSWYLANDMQFHYFIAPIILPLIFLYGRWGTISGGIIISISLCVTGVISGVNSYGTAVGDSFDTIYVKPWCRVSPYIVGLMLGYLLLEHQRRRWRLHRVIVVVGWLVAFGLGLTTIYGLAGVNGGSYKLSVGVAALYNAASRFTWSLSLGWLIYACLTGNGGWINRFLSWPGFIPLSRLTYCAYLVHPVVMTFIYQTFEYSPVVNTLTMVYWFFGHMIAAYMLAFILSLVWESPLIGLERILLKKN